jgi:hypothetical protein
MIDDYVHGTLVEYIRENNFSHYYFVHHKSHTDWLQIRSERSATDRLTNGTVRLRCWHRVTDVSEKHFPSYLGPN